MITVTKSAGENCLFLIALAIGHFEKITSDRSSANNNASAMLNTTWQLYQQIRCNRLELIAAGLDERWLDEFKAQLHSFETTRHENLHAYDPRPGKNPNKVHQQVSQNGLTIAVDSTSIVPLGPTEVFRGKINLYTLYQKLKFAEPKFKEFWGTKIYPRNEF